MKKRKKMYQEENELVFDTPNMEVAFTYHSNKTLDIDTIMKYNNATTGVCIFDEDLDKLIRWLIKHRLKET